jgi:hypothetical protein
MRPIARARLRAFAPRVLTAKDVEAHGDEAPAEVVRVLAQARDLAEARAGAVFALHDAEGREDLLAHDGAHGVVEQEARRLAPHVRHELARARDVAAHGAEALGEGAHEHVDERRVHAGVLADAAPARAHGADRVRLVEVDVALVALGDAHDALQVLSLIHI